MLDHIIAPYEILFLKLEVVSIAVTTASMAHSVVQWWRVIGFRGAIIVWFWMSYACAPLLKFT